MANEITDAFFETAVDLAELSEMPCLAFNETVYDSIAVEESE